MKSEIEQYVMLKLQNRVTREVEHDIVASVDATISNQLRAHLPSKIVSSHRKQIWKKFWIDANDKLATKTKDIINQQMYENIRAVTLI